MASNYTRYTAAGNTFIIMNGMERPLEDRFADVPAFVRLVCDPHHGPGSDGLIALEPSRLGAPFKMSFYNPDGSTGMLCGNGSRCAVRAARDAGITSSDTTTFEVLGNIVSAELLPHDSVRVHFKDPSVVRAHMPLELEGRSIAAGYVDLGSQHVVVFANDLLGSEDTIDSLDVGKFGALLRWHAQLAPVGANANFIEVREDEEGRYLRIRTFERGVEGETLACGTGCMSSAIIATLLGHIDRQPVRLLTQSGEFVRVAFQSDASGIHQLSLEGPVVEGQHGLVGLNEATGGFAWTTDRD